jgi:hypothetical protein
MNGDMIAWAVLIVTSAVLVVIAGWALLQLPRWARVAWLWLRPRPARHRIRPGDAAAERASDARLRGVPAPGRDIYSDQTVRLPWTPPLAEIAPEGHWLNLPPDSEEFQREFWGEHYGQPGEPGEPVSVAELDEMAARYKAGRPLTFTVSPAGAGRPDLGYTAPPVLADVTDAAPPRRPSTEGVREVTGHVVTAPHPAGDRCRCDLPEGHFAAALLAAPPDKVDDLFSTGQFRAVGA